VGVYDSIMKAKFIERHVGIVFVLLLLSSVLTGSVYGKGLFTSVDEIECSDSVVKVFTKCPREDKPDSTFECTKQHFVFLDKKTGESTDVISSGEAVPDLGPEGELLGNYLDALAFSWACVKGKSDWYLLVRYTTFGTCEDCEWTEVYSLKGYRLADGRTQYSQTDSEKNSRKNKFKETYGHLGLPTPWPRDAFKYMGFLKASGKH